MSILKNRIAAVAVGATVVVALGSTGAVAARIIGSADIKDGSIRSIDIANGTLTGADVRDGGLTGDDIRNSSVRSADIVDGAVRLADLSPDARAAFAPPVGTIGVEVATLAAPKAIAHIGGGINANNTDLDTGLTLPAGRYLITVDGAFESAQAAADPSVDVYPQLSLWIDRSGDGAFQWQQQEGDISPNALMPAAANRHISVSGTTVVELTEETYVGLLGFGYDSAQGTARSGDINVKSATLTATPLS